MDKTLDSSISPDEYGGYFIIPAYGYEIHLLKGGIPADTVIRASICGVHGPASGRMIPYHFLRYRRDSRTLDGVKIVKE